MPPPPPPPLPPPPLINDSGIIERLTRGNFVSEYSSIEVSIVLTFQCVGAGGGAPTTGGAATTGDATLTPCAPNSAAPLAAAVAALAIFASEFLAASAFARNASVASLGPPRSLRLLLSFDFAIIGSAEGVSGSGQPPTTANWIVEVAERQPVMIQGLRQRAGSLLQKGFSDVPNGQIVLFPLLFPFFFSRKF